MKPVSGVAPEIMTALPRPEAGAAELGLAPLRAHLAHGAFGYALPLEAPLDRGGRRLELALAYDARRHGNGVFGVGWDLLQPRIERRTDLGVPRYDPTDRFAISDGVRLEAVGGGRHRAETERDFRRIPIRRPVLGDHRDRRDPVGVRRLGHSRASSIPVIPIGWPPGTSPRVPTPTATSPNTGTCATRRSDTRRATRRPRSTCTRSSTSSCRPVCTCAPSGSTTTVRDPTRGRATAPVSRSAPIGGAGRCSPWPATSTG